MVVSHMSVLQFHGPITYCVLQWCHPMLTGIQRRTSCSARMITLYGDHVIKLDSGPHTLASALTPMDIIHGTPTWPHFHPPCRHQVAITGDLFKFVHFRNPPSRTDIWWQHSSMYSGQMGGILVLDLILKTNKLVEVFTI